MEQLKQYKYVIAVAAIFVLIVIGIGAFLFIGADDAQERPAYEPPALSGATTQEQRNQQEEGGVPPQDIPMPQIIGDVRHDTVEKICARNIAPSEAELKGMFDYLSNVIVSGTRFFSFKRAFLGMTFIHKFLNERSVSCADSEWMKEGGDLCDEEQIRAFRELRAYLLYGDEAFLETMTAGVGDAEGERVITRLMQEAKTNKTIVLTAEEEGKLCVPNQETANNSIVFYERDGAQKSCRFDGGHIFNTILAFAEKDAGICDNSDMPQYEFSKTFCMAHADQEALARSQALMLRDFCGMF